MPVVLLLITLLISSVRVLSCLSLLTQLGYALSGTLGTALVILVVLYLLKVI